MRHATSAPLLGTPQPHTPREATRMVIHKRLPHPTLPTSAQPQAPSGADRRDGTVQTYRTGSRPLLVPTTHTPLVGHEPINTPKRPTQATPTLEGSSSQAPVLDHPNHLPCPRPTSPCNWPAQREDGKGSSSACPHNRGRLTCGRLRHRRRHRPAPARSRLHRPHHRPHRLSPQPPVAAAHTPLPHCRPERSHAVDDVENGMHWVCGPVLRTQVLAPGVGTPARQAPAGRPVRPRRFPVVRCAGRHRLRSPRPGRPRRACPRCRPPRRAAHRGAGRAARPRIRHW
ncbi:hypothetical protein B0E37_01530 [Streptomyces sp. MH192]|nr:hypothetical protein [Streptomyces sp. MH192]MCF0098094.1 hypothetical protein [Streptomyces sp. MH191]